MHVWCRQVYLVLHNHQERKRKTGFCVCTAPPSWCCKINPCTHKHAHAGPIAIQASTLSSGYLCVQTAKIRDYPKHPAAILTPTPCHAPCTLVESNGHTGRSRASRRLKAPAAVVMHFEPGLAGTSAPQAAQYVPALIINYWSVILACLVRLVRWWRPGLVREYSHRSTSLSARSTPCLAPAAG